VVQGVSELQAGDYLKALDLFQRAYALFPSHKILFNLGQVYRELGRIVDALDAYERFLREATKSAETALLAVARKQVVTLKGQVATILVPVEEPGGAIYVDGREVGITPMDVPYRVMPGTHAIEVRKAGFVSATANVTLVAGQRLVKPLVLRRPSKVVVKQVVFQLRRKPRKGLPVLWAGVAATAAFGAALAVTGSLALYEYGVYKDTTKTVARRDLAVTRGRRYQWATEGLIAATGVSAIFTTVWGLVVVKRSGGVERVPVPAEGSGDAGPSVRLLPAGAGLLLEATF
jgi:tetratricopeptide (TPR) repeat protein